MQEMVCIDAEPGNGRRNIDAERVDVTKVRMMPRHGGEWSIDDAEHIDGQIEAAAGEPLGGATLERRTVDGWGQVDAERVEAMSQVFVERVDGKRSNGAVGDDGRGKHGSRLK